MSLPLPPPVPEDDEWASDAAEVASGRPGDDVERTEAFWHPGMSRATYIRLLRLLFDAPPDHGDGGSRGSGGRAA